MTNKFSLALAAAFGLSLFARAGAQDIEKEVQKPIRESRQERKVQETAKEAQKLAVEGPEVTYEQVMADPDNVDLNYRFARSQVRAGDLKGASATLERILLVNPNLTNVRFFYAVVLYRLEDLVGAERQFEMLEKADLPAEAKTEVQTYLKSVRKRQKRTRLSGRIAVGYEYDSNRNASPSSGQRLFQGIPLNVTGTGRTQEDTAWIFMVGADARRKVGRSGRHELFASLDYYRAEQSVIETLNLSALSVRAGGTYHTHMVDLSPRGIVEHVELAHQNFLNNRGGALRFERKWSRTTNLYFEVRGVYQDYTNTHEIPVADQRTGEEYDFAGGADWVLTPKTRLGLVLLYSDKRAREAFNAFHREAAELSGSYLLGQGTFLYGSALINYDHYQDPDPFVSPNYRQDTTVRLSATYGAPLGIIHRALKDFVWTATYEYYRALSTIENYQYTNNRVSTLLTYRWELGL